MNRLPEILNAKMIFAACLVLAATILVFLAPKAAVNIDEQPHNLHAEKVVNWYFTGGADKSCLDTPVTNLKYYGQSVDNMAALVNRIFKTDDKFLVRHYVGAVFFWLLLLFAGLVAFRLSRSYMVSAIAVISIMAFPPLFGHAFGNLKDIPFATGYLAGIYLIMKLFDEFPLIRWKTAIFLGLAIAFTVSVRVGGLILFGYLGLALIVTFIQKPFLLKHIFSTKLNLIRTLGQGVVILLVGYFAGLFFWPFALQNVLANPFESLRVMEHYTVSIRQVFDGEWLWSTQLPWYYLPRWLLISTPGFLILGLLTLLILMIFKIGLFEKQLSKGLFLFFAFLFPVVYVIAIGSNLYSGTRQMIFVLPLIAIFSAFGFVELYKLLNPNLFKWAWLIFFLRWMIIPVKHQASTFPADYIFFNDLAGGNKKAWSNYEYDYYFHGLKEPAAYLLKLIGTDSVSVACNAYLPNYFEKSGNVTFRFTRYTERSSFDWDYGIFGVNYIHPDQLKSGKWQSAETIKTFYQKGNPVAVILKRTDKSDYLGIEKSKEGNLAEADILLKKALADDSNNVWLILQLAKNSFQQNDFESFNRYLQQGRLVYPQYEPFYLLEAQDLYNRNELKRAKDVLDKLVEINPRYKNAAPLLKAVNEKLNIR